MLFTIRVAGLLLVASLLTGCGLKGSLYLPDEKKQDKKEQTDEAKKKVDQKVDSAEPES